MSGTFALRAPLGACSRTAPGRARPLVPPVAFYPCGARTLCQETVGGAQCPARGLVVAMAADPAADVKWEPSDAVLECWRNADAVCFDVDSTLCEDESIDEVAAFLGVGDKVAELTASAMGGDVKFEDALAARLSLMNVSAKDMARFLDAHPPRISPGIRELVSGLQEAGKEVFLVSGGFRQIINPIADILKVPRTHVFANTILYKDDAEGSYAGFDAQEFTSRSGGKANAVRHIRKEWGLTRVVMIGDGATDLEARVADGAEMFIGYGGVVFRPNVAAGADWYVKTFDPLIEGLK
ncbi:unnamed protein product [Pedinophyceae sp. YPF-701]|nr:unnamed protein product [Pedinophyceae sp. YPF-701]